VIKAQQGTAKGAKANATKDNSLSWIWDNIVNYTWKKSVHSITATGVFSAQKYQYDRLYGASKDLSFNSLWYNLNGGAIESLSSNFSQWTMMSYVGRINYGLMDRYLLTASLRYDGSSRCPKEINGRFSLPQLLRGESLKKTLPRIWIGCPT